jgi:hypothetical protein
MDKLHLILGIAGWAWLLVMIAVALIQARGRRSGPSDARPPAPTHDPQR